MKRTLIALLVLFAALSSKATNHVWTNTLGGNWFVPANWSPFGVPTNLDAAIITNNGTYTVNILTNVATVAGLTLGGSSGTQTLLNGTPNLLSVTNSGTVRANGLLSVTNGGLLGNITIQAGGTLSLSGVPTKNLYNLDLLNQGTILWSGGSLIDGGSPATSAITNAGLWDIQTDNNLNWSSGSVVPRLINTGTLRKSAGSGITYLYNQDFVQNGFVDVQSGTVIINTPYTNILAGTVNVNPGATFDIVNGVYYDSGGVFTNSGIHQITGGTLNLRTNFLTGLSLDGGTVLLGPGFQQAGVITNLTLNGATLAGTNILGNGLLTVSNGTVSGQMTVQASGTLSFAGSGTKALYGLDLRNLGTILWSGGSLVDGGSPASVITNAGLWDIQTDNNINWASGSVVPRLINTGTLRKSAGSGITYLYNQDLLQTGFIDVRSGTLTINTPYTNILAGAVNVNPGATFDIVNGAYYDSGGVFTNSGIHQITGGTLTLRTNVIAGLSLDGGTLLLGPGFQQGGVITNLTLNGITLAGTNTIGPGTLTVSNGTVSGQLTVQANGTLSFAGPGAKALYGLDLRNLGTILWSGGSLADGGSPATVITNAGLWDIQTDNNINFTSGSIVPRLINTGTLRKSGGPGFTYLYNQDLLQTGFIDVQMGTLIINTSYTNILAGAVNVDPGATFDIVNGVYYDSGGVFTNSGIHQITGGTLTLRTNVVAGLSLDGGTLVLGPGFQQGGVITNLTLNGITLTGTNTIGSGTLTVSNGTVSGQLTVQASGTLSFAGAGTKNLYSLDLRNLGTMLWLGGGLADGGAPVTVITNAGLWDIQTDNSINWTSGSIVPRLINTGTLRKSGGPGYTYFYNQDFLQTGFIDVRMGTLDFNTSYTNILAGTVNVNAGATFDFVNGVYYDSGGVFTNSGIHQITGGTLTLRTNVLTGLSLDGGTLLLGPGFQQSGIITNLTLNGSTLTGTNVLSGLLTVSNGTVSGQLTVQASGTLSFPGPGTKGLYSLDLRNLGTILWTGGPLADGGIPPTVITNFGLWDIQTDNNLNWTSGSILPRFFNQGTFRKSAGSGTTFIYNHYLENDAAGLIQANTGTLQLPSGFTNTAGILRLNGGTFTASSQLTVDGGSLDGSGSVGANLFIGGTLSPGQGGPGLISFPSGLDMGAGSTLTLSGAGTAPGTYDQLSVVGSVILSNATLQVTSLPTVSGGTTFIIITNDGSDAVLGTFNGLPENASLNVGGQTFQIHYAGGSGNDVTLVRGGGAAAPQLNFSGFTNGNWRLAGSGAAATLFTIQATTNFLSWTNVGSIMSDGSGKFIFVDTNTPHFHYRFFRTTN